jgi:hypothetical protein
MPDIEGGDGELFVHSLELSEPAANHQAKSEDSDAPAVQRGRWDSDFSEIDRRLDKS